MDELDRILNSEAFRYSYRMSRMLRFLVEHTLEFPARPLKEHLLAVGVFDKPETFDSRIDPIVRVEASRLRAKLRDFYHGEGASHRLSIHLPRRGYRPVLTVRSPQIESFPHQGRKAAGERGLRSVVKDAPPSLLVLPFLDLSPGGSEEYFCDGLTEELINLLARVDGLRVVARTSAFRFKAVAMDIREIAERLDVSAVLESSVRRDQDMLCASVQLLNAADGYHIWSDKFQRPLRQVLSLQHEIANAIAEVLKVKLDVQTEDSQVPVGKPEDAEAYSLYLRGLHAWHRRTADGFVQAIALLQQAAKAEPEDPRIHSKLAQCQVGLLLSTAADTRETLRVGEDCCERALSLFPGMGEALAVRGFVHAIRDWRWVESGSDFERALTQAPADPTIHEWYAIACLAPHARYDEAIAHLGRALDLDPLSVSVRSHLGLVYHLQRRYNDAARELELSLELEPDFYRGRFDLGAVYTMMGRYDAALEAYDAGRRSNPDRDFRLGDVGYCYGRAAMRREALDTLDRLRGMPTSYCSSAFCMAQTLAGMGDAKAAVEMLKQAVQERAYRLIWLKQDPSFEILRGDQGFQEICRTMGL